MTNILVCDGGIYTANYLWEIGIQADEIYLNFRDFYSNLTYMMPEDVKVLIFIHSCTVFSLVDCIKLLNTLEQAEISYEIFSNVDVPKFNYIHYTEDFLTSKKVLVVNNKKKEVREEKQSEKYLEPYLDWKCSLDNVVLSLEDLPNAKPYDITSEPLYNKIIQF